MTLLFCHANGFPASSYRAFFQALAQPVHYVEKLGHSHFSLRKDVRELAHELLDFLQAFDKPIQVIGHSSGAIIAMQAKMLAPEAIDQLVLMEPPIFRPTKRHLIGLVQRLGLSEHLIPPAKSAARRKTQFHDPEHAFYYFRKKKFFDRVGDDVLWDYVRSGLEQKSDGSWGLSFSPDLELKIFSSLPVRLPSTWQSIQGLFVMGTETDLYTTRDRHWLQRYFRAMQWADCPGSHIFPLESPIEAANLIRPYLAK
ncbi:MAG: alpha/beta hydrolase [Acidobacteria bacterium]|nr:alpha/beta hydrolase [Acidobacteriota bacterium]